MKQRVDQPALANVNLHGTLGVDGEPLVRVDGDAEETWVGVDELILVANNWIPQNASIVQVGQAWHVIRAVKLGWIDLTDLIGLEDLFLEAKKLGLTSAWVLLAFSPHKGTAFVLDSHIQHRLSCLDTSFWVWGLRYSLGSG